MTDMARTAQDRQDRRVFVEFMVEDMLIGITEGDSGRVGDLADEINARWGPDATENTAQYITGTKMTGMEMVLWAATEWKQVKRILKGKEER
jgi:hypothetical protein